MKMKIKRSLLAGAVALACGNALGAEYWLCAGTFDKSMPDNSVVQMWGYADVSNTTTYPGHVCPASGNAAYTAPGPQLDIPFADTSLTVHLQNTLAEPTSLVIPGQTETDMAPVMIGNRVQSFTHEALTGLSGDYTWTNLKPGSYAYQTGTHPAKQVQMGLYGAMVKDAAASTAYPGINYDTQVVEFLSEIDPVLHSRVADGSYGSPCADANEQKTNPCTSTIGYNPKWFLVNGEIFVDPSPSLPAAPALIAGGNTGETSLIRFINMGLRSHSIILQGASMKVVAEDGHVLPVHHDQYSLMVAAGKTHDAVFTPVAEGVYPLYERMHNLSTTDSTGAIKVGGLVSFLNVGAGASTLTAVNDVFSGNEDTVITGNVLSNDTPSTGLTAALVSGPAGFVLNQDGSFSHNLATLAPNFNGQLSFTYQANDGTPPLSNVATVDLNIAAVNDAPTITSAAVTAATEDAAYAYTLTATDVDTSDTPPQTLSYSLVTAPAGMTINATSGAINWTPTNAQVGNNSVTARVTDSATPALTADQTFIVAVANTNDAPTLNFIPAQNAVAGAAFNLTAVGNDIDVGDTRTYSLTGPDGMTINATTGAINWPVAVLGTHNVTVTVTDGSLATASQIFTLTVNAAAGTPVVYFSTLGASNPTGLAGTADDADIYSWDGTAFNRVVNMANSGGEVGVIANAIPTGANVDELKIVDATHFYLSFVTDKNLPGLGTVQDEDIVYYNGTTWSVFFNGTDPNNNAGTANGLTNTNHDIDAFDIAGANVYFSLSGSTNASNPPGVGDTTDTGDIYRWNGTTFSRVFDLSQNTPAKGRGPAATSSTSVSNVDGLKYVDAAHFYMSFAGNVTLTNSPNSGGATLTVQDEDIVYYNAGVWTVYFDGTPGLGASGNQDIDGFDIKP